MNLKDALGTAARLRDKFVSVRMQVHEMQDQASARQGAEAFRKFFEELDFAERKILVELDRYSVLLGVYDDVVRGSPIRTYTAQHVFEAADIVASFCAELSRFVPLDAEFYHRKMAIEINFPLAVGASSSFELQDEFEWFLKIFNRVSNELSIAGERPKIHSIDNEKVSLPILVDWKFLLASMVVWSCLFGTDDQEQSVRSAIALLKSSGLTEQKVLELQNEFKLGAESAIDKAEKEYRALDSGELPSGWSASFHALGKHLETARDRGYGLGFMVGNFPFLLTEPSAEEIAKVRYMQQHNYLRSADHIAISMQRQLEGASDIQPMIRKDSRLNAKGARRRPLWFRSVSGSR